MKLSVMKPFLIVLLSLITMSIFSSIALASITKCKDANGNWHYGSNASSQCADSSEITSLNQSGVEVKKVAAVKTKEQLLLEKEQRDKETERLNKAKFEQAEKERILMVYQSEKDIERVRGNQLDALQQKEDQHKNYIEALKRQKVSLEKKKAKTTNAAIVQQLDEKILASDEKVKSSEKRIIDLKEQTAAVNEKFANDLLKFQEYKDKP